MNQINSIMATPTTAGTLVTSGKYAGYTKQEVAGSPGTVIYRAAGSPMIRPQVQTNPSNKDNKKESSGSGVIISEKMTITDYPNSSTKRTRTINVPQPSVIEVPGQPSTTTIKSGPHKGETISIPGKSTTIVSTGAWDSPASEGIKQRMLNQQQTTEQQVSTGSVSTIGSNLSGALGNYGSNIPQEFLISSQQKTQGTDRSYTPKPSPRSTGSGSGGRSRSQSTGGYPGSPGQPMTPAYPGAEPTSPAVVTSPTITVGGRGGVTVPVSDLSIRNVAVGQVDRYGRQTVVSKTDFINTQEVLRQSLANPKEALERAGLIISPSSSQQSVQTRSQAPDYDFQLQSQFKAQAIEERFYSKGLTVAYAEGTTYAGLKEITTSKAETTFKDKTIGDMARSIDKTFFTGAKAEQTALLNQISYEAKGTTISGFSTKTIEPGASLTGSFMKTGISSVSSNIPEYILKRELGTSTTMDYSPKISSGTKTQTIPSLRLNEYDLLKAETMKAKITASDYASIFLYTAKGTTAGVVTGAAALGSFAVANLAAVGKTVTGQDFAAVPKLYMGVGAGIYVLGSSVYSELKQPKMTAPERIATTYVEGVSLLTFGKLMGVTGKVVSKNVDFAGTRFPIVKSLQLRFISKEARITKATEEAQAMFKRTKESPFAAVETKYGVKIRTVARETGGIPNIIADTVKKPSFGVRAEQWWRSKTGKTPEQYTLKEMGIKPRGKIESFLSPTKLTIEQELGRMIEAKTGQSRLNPYIQQSPKLSPVEKELMYMIDIKSVYGQQSLLSQTTEWRTPSRLDTELRFMGEYSPAALKVSELPPGSPGFNWLSPETGMALIDVARSKFNYNLDPKNLITDKGMATIKMGKELFVVDIEGNLHKLSGDTMFGRESGGLLEGSVFKIGKDTLKRVTDLIKSEMESPPFRKDISGDSLGSGSFKGTGTTGRNLIDEGSRMRRAESQMKEFESNARLLQKEPATVYVKEVSVLKETIKEPVYIKQDVIIKELTVIRESSMFSKAVSFLKDISKGRTITPVGLVAGAGMIDKPSYSMLDISGTKQDIGSTGIGGVQDISKPDVKVIDTSGTGINVISQGAGGLNINIGGTGSFARTFPNLVVPSFIAGGFLQGKNITNTIREFINAPSVPFPSVGSDIGSAEFGNFGGRGFGGELGRMKTQYTPSITAIGLGIYGKVTSKVTTGLELRPLPGKKSRMKRLI